jgi:long-subunit acyl-CoA synthetase (AMP-forming)
VVALDLDNGPAWVSLDIAALQLGICLVPLPRFFAPGQLRHALRASGAQLVLSDAPQQLRRRAAGLLEDRESPLEVAGRSLVAVATQPANRRQAVAPPADVCKITFTSGTTGEPKGAMLTWSQIRAVVASLADATGMSAGDRHLCLMPLSVLLENIGGVYVPLWAGAATTVLPLHDTGLSGAAGLEPRRLLAALGATAATTVILTPQVLQGLIEVLEGAPRVRLNLRFAALGGAAVPPRLHARAAALGLPVYEGYGLSECASVVCLNTPAAHRPGSVGRPLPHVRLRIADHGEVMVAGHAFAGYLGGAAIQNGEWPTGDLGELDADGFLYLRGRRRNVFVTAYGRNVAPEWVEGELTLEPAIAQAAVFGEARPYNVAIIVAAPGGAWQDVSAALARCNRGLPDYARVSHWAAADAPFSPANGLLTGTGRLRREALHAHYAATIESLYREARTS